MGKVEDLDPAERRQRYRENQNYFSQTLSELTRYVGFGLVAFAYGVMTAEGRLALAISDAAAGALLVAGLCGCMVILCDFLHLSFGWWSNALAAENEKGAFELPRRGRTLRNLQQAMFYAKQAIAFVGCVIVVTATATLLL